jgi:hypothetical protein
MAGDETRTDARGEAMAEMRARVAGPTVPGGAVPGDPGWNLAAGWRGRALACSAGLIACAGYQPHPQSHPGIRDPRVPKRPVDEAGSQHNGASHRGPGSRRHAHRSVGAFLELARRAPGDAGLDGVGPDCNNPRLPAARVAGALRSRSVHGPGIHAGRSRGTTRRWQSVVARARSSAVVAGWLIRRPSTKAHAARRYG